MDEIIVINTEQLRELLSDTVRATLTELGLSNEPMNAKYYTKKQVLELWNISQSTLWRLEKLGYIKGKYIGKKRYYEKTVIDNFDIDKFKNKKSA